MIVLTATLLLISLLLSGMMILAWRTFGRPVHAFTWASAFVMVALSFGIQLLEVIGILLDPLSGLVSSIIAISGSALFAIGFRERARLPQRTPALMVLTLLTASAMVFLSLHAPSSGALAALPMLFFALMAGIAARTLKGRRSSERAERATRAMLLLVVLTHLGIGVIALAQDIALSHAPLNVISQLRMLIAPATLISTGIFVVFLLASDLAAHMQKLAASDPLTGILNRRGFEQEAMPLLESARRRRRPMTMVMADIDRFKSINDHHGHAAGDRALCWFADQLGAAIRRRDLFARVGGEEFAIILADLSVDEAQAAIEAVREQLAKAPVEGLSELELTASFGIASFQEEEEDDLLSLMKRADRALYRAKSEGRNRICLAD